jgi:hypothetical protein
MKQKPKGPKKNKRSKTENWEAKKKFESKLLTKIGD